MSLVLNTNNSGGGGYVLTNDFIDSYPDAKNSILMLPLFGVGGNGIGISNGATILTLPAIKNVNGTPINFFSQKICFPEHLTGINGNSYGGSGVGNPATNFSCTFRYGLDTPLQGGEIVGKKIIFAKCGITYSQNRPTSGTIKRGQTVRLLHSDGTLTNVGNYEFDINFSTDLFEVSITWGNYSHLAMPLTDVLKIIEGNGVIAQAGDYIVIDCSYNANGTAVNQSHGIGLGYVYSPSSSGRASFNQISID